MFRFYSKYHLQRKKSILVIIFLGVISVSWLILVFSQYAKNININFSDRKRTDLPWQTILHPDNSLTVMDIHLGVSTLQDAIKKFGFTEDISLFRSGTNKLLNIEVYFDKVILGLLKMKIILVLDISEEQKRSIEHRIIEKYIMANRDTKMNLASQDKNMLLSSSVKSLICIPKYHGLKASFFRKRFGEPQAWQHNNKITTWFYPRIGLTLSINSSGSEILEYISPKDFLLPAEVILSDKSFN